MGPAKGKLLEVLLVERSAQVLALMMGKLLEWMMVHDLAQMLDLWLDYWKDSM